MEKIIFKCSCCGECCRKISDENSELKGLPLFEWEVERIKELAIKNKIKLNIEPIDLVFDKKSEKYFCTGYVLADEPCVFLKYNKCLIHEERPIVCRAFPVAKHPLFLESVPDLSCFSKCCKFDFYKFILKSLGLEEGKEFSLGEEKILSEYEKTFGEEIMRASWIRDRALNYFDESIKRLSNEGLIEIEIVEKKKEVEPISFLQFLVERGFITKEDRKKIISEFEN